MPAKASGEAIKQIHYLTAALKAPRITRPRPGWAARPATSAGPTRTTWRLSWNGKSVPQRLRRPATHPRRRVRSRQDPGGLRLRRPTRHPAADRSTGLRGVLERGQQRRAARATWNRQDQPGHRAGHRRGPHRTACPVRHRHRLGHPPQRGASAAASLYLLKITIRRTSTAPVGSARTFSRDRCALRYS